MAQDLGLSRVSSPKTTKLDVVFLRGLGGHRSKTWTNSSGEFWPAWLANEVPDTRVWTYGYNSSFWNSPSEDALELHCAQLLDKCEQEEIGKQDAKVVFVCHSLGGILFKSVRRGYLLAKLLVRS
jgi:hypothetical protein